MQIGINRRQFVTVTAGTGLAHVIASQPMSAADSTENLRLGRFRFDVTPPAGHSLCGGWIKPVTGVDDPLEAVGYVLQGAGKPIVICAVDWTGLLNSAHRQWRQALADAAGTSIDRVAVQCVHQHNAPFACMDAEQIILEQGDLPHIIEPQFFQTCLTAARKAVSQAIAETVPVTHIGRGQARVSKVASNRRIIGLDGKLISQRGSSSRDPKHHRYPEGLIDPMLKTIAFYNGDKKLVASHFYACHPMSYYGDGRVSADFCGLARKQRQSQEPDCLHLYFNGCGGNIGAGKYNDGSKQARLDLTRRMFDGIVASEADLNPQPIRQLAWQTHDILPPLNPNFDESELMAGISNRENKIVARNRPSYAVAFIRRINARLPITLSSLHVNDVSLMHLPAECFIEYQLRAQAAAPDRFIACAAYGDGGPWYIPTKESYPQGGYAVSVAMCGPEMDSILSNGIQTLLPKT
ncbi:MAG: hypothetical protein GY768_18415 [Planctomycetaceae bacterium]|nr:hypothetical protein [Planctomycetaceae bacterium]